MNLSSMKGPLGLPCQPGTSQGTTLGALDTPTRLGKSSFFYSTNRILNRMKVNSNKKNVDWDGAWKSFQNTNNRQQQKPPAFDRRQKVSSPLDKIRKEEERVLGTWSSTRFTQLGLASVVLLLVLLVVVSGGPPTDSRCTLPWC